MTGSSLVAIILPAVAFTGMAFWLGMVFHADNHPGYGRRQSRQGLAATTPHQEADQPPAAGLGELASYGGTSATLAPSLEREEVANKAPA